MTREEFGIIAKGMRALYANDSFMPDKDAFDVWYALLNSYDYKDVSLATQTYMASEEFPPKPANIIRLIQKLHQSESRTEMEAWSLVRKAISNSAYNASAEFEKLPEDVQKVISSPDMLHEWSQLNIDEVETVIQSNFMRSYKAKANDRQELDKLPAHLRAEIEANSHLMIEGQ